MRKLVVLFLVLGLPLMVLGCGQKEEATDEKPAATDTEKADDTKTETETETAE